jgi:hypothetical protein
VNRSHQSAATGRAVTMSNKAHALIAGAGIDRGRRRRRVSPDGMCVLANQGDADFHFDDGSAIAEPTRPMSWFDG